MMQKNQSFYSHVEEKEFIKHAKLSGLADNKDIDLIYKRYICGKNNLLEIGGGYGRVLDELNARGYQGEITCYERNIALFDKLIRKYPRDVNFFKFDIAKELVVLHKFAIILWLWSSIGELSIDEQNRAYENIAKLLHNSGYLIIDSINFAENTPYKIFDIQSHGKTLSRIFPSVSTLTDSLSIHKMTFIESIDYAVTKSGLLKTLLIFKKL